MREVHPGCPKLARPTHVAHWNRIQKLFKTKRNQIYIRNLTKRTEKLSSLGRYTLNLDVIRRRKTHRLVEQRNGLSRPGTSRRRYDHQTKRTVFVPTRPNKRSKEEIAELDAELLRRAAN